MSPALYNICLPLHITSFSMHHDLPPFVFIFRERVKSIVQGFLPGIALKIFLVLLPTILMAMSKIEGLTSFSSLDRRTAGKYHLFIIVNVFFGSIITGAAFEQLEKFLNQAPSEYVAYSLLVACNCNPYTLLRIN